MSSPNNWQRVKIVALVAQFVQDRGGGGKVYQNMLTHQEESGSQGSRKMFQIQESKGGFYRPSEHCKFV